MTIINLTVWLYDDDYTINIMMMRMMRDSWNLQEPTKKKTAIFFIRFFLF